MTHCPDCGSAPPCGCADAVVQPRIIGIDIARGADFTAPEDAAAMRPKFVPLLVEVMLAQLLILLSNRRCLAVQRHILVMQLRGNLLRIECALLRICQLPEKLRVQHVNLLLRARGAEELDRLRGRLDRAGHADERVEAHAGDGTTR